MSKLRNVYWVLLSQIVKLIQRFLTIFSLYLRVFVELITDKYLKTCANCVSDHKVQVKAYNKCEMSVVNEEFSNVLTPNKKRRRNFDSFAFWSNSAEIPSSTPITSADKSLGKASFENPSFKRDNKENSNFNFMEQKSIGKF